MECVGTGDPPGSHLEFRAYTNVLVSFGRQSDIEHPQHGQCEGEHWELADVVGSAEHQALLMDEPDENEFAWELQQLAHLAFASVDLILHVESVYLSTNLCQNSTFGTVAVQGRSHCN